MRIGICDDEAKLRHALLKVAARELELLGIDFEIREYSSGEELLRESPPEEPDILFLDIEMDKMNGMEAAKELRRRHKNTVLIFVTAYPDFVFQGYEVHALHYILKPYEEEKIRKVLRMALEELDSLKEQYYVARQKSGVMKLPLSKVHYFKSDRKKVRAVMDGKAEEFYGSLSEMDTELPSYFIRCHNRYLVNLNYVTRVEGNLCICGDDEIPVSRSCRQAMLVAFAKTILK